CCFPDYNPCFFLLVQEFLERKLFFFSSRRRHTRFSRDWSSDVCSSDLDAPSGHVRFLQSPVLASLSGLAPCLPCACVRYPHIPRSEERRVGKECRSRWSSYYY